MPSRDEALVKIVERIGPIKLPSCSLVSNGKHVCFAGADGTPATLIPLVTYASDIEFAARDWIAERKVGVTLLSDGSWTAYTATGREAHAWPTWAEAALEVIQALKAAEKPACITDYEAARRLERERDALSDRVAVLGPELVHALAERDEAIRKWRELWGEDDGCILSGRSDLCARPAL
jgi:hypothetical protein